MNLDFLTLWAASAILLS